MRWPNVFSVASVVVSLATFAGSGGAAGTAHAASAVSPTATSEPRFIREAQRTLGGGGSKSQGAIRCHDHDDVRGVGGEVQGCAAGRGRHLRRSDSTWRNAYGYARYLSRLSEIRARNSSNRTGSVLIDVTHVVDIDVSDIDVRDVGDVRDIHAVHVSLAHAIRGPVDFTRP